MKIYLSKSKNVYENLALEEALLKLEGLEEDILYIYQNDNVVVVGKNQNTYAEIDQEFVKKHKITIARRISGGGAVYQDMGNVCFSLITKNTKENSFRAFLTPIVAFLKSLGLKAEFKGRNDVVANGYKISGNAQFLFKDRMVHHGTLLFDTDLSVLSKALKPNLLKLKSKAIKSVRQRVSNIKDLLDSDMSTNEFIDKLTHFFSKDNTDMIISDKILSEVKTIRKRTESWDWIYGKSPKFEHRIEYYFQGGLVEILINIEKAKIQDIVIHGDFLSKKDISVILEDLKGTPYTKEAISKVLNKYNLEDYFGIITSSDIVELILKSAQ